MFITFEGMEGCGKTTQVERLARALTSRGIRVVRTFEPGGTPAGEKIRRILLDRDNRDLASMAELCLYEADRAQHVAVVIRPALERGDWVICDRFFDATVVYQGMARGQDLELIRDLNRTVTGGIRPDLTFLLDCPVEEGLKRALRRNQSLSDKGQDRFEREAAVFHEAVREGYLEIARMEPDRFVVINASLGPDEVEAVVLQSVEPLVERRR
ncbi:MAG: dTMP kinase [Thermodesulfobacteriota bacterium]